MVDLTPAWNRQITGDKPRLRFHLGRSNHPDDGGVTGGFHVGADVQLWWLIVGGTVGVDAYPSDGAPVRATTRPLAPMPIAERQVLVYGGAWLRRVR